jgi:hypothetical protein
MCGVASEPAHAGEEQCCANARVGRATGLAFAINSLGDGQNGKKAIAREREVCWLLQHERAPVGLPGWREIEGDCLSVLDCNVL